MNPYDFKVLTVDIALKPRILRAYASELDALADRIEGCDVPKPAESELPAQPTPPAPAPEPLPETAQAPVPANVTEATQHPADVELDSDRLPWDSRIHSSSKKQNQDGTWRLKRGLDAALVERVKAELRTALAAPAVPAAPEQPATTAAAPELTPEPSAGSVFGDHSTPPPPPAAEPTPAAAPSDTPQNYAEFMTRMSTVSADRVNQVLQGLGVPNVALLSTRPDLIPAAWEQLKGEASA